MNPPQRGTPDFFLLSLTVALVGFGLVMVFSASYSITFQDDPLSFTKKQALWVVLGTIVMFVTMNTSYLKVKKLFLPFFLFVLCLLVLVLIIGVERNGAKSWFQIGPFGGQPTEFAKIGIILYLSVMIGRKGEKIKNFKTGLLPLLIMVGFVCLLIMLQPDLGSTVILLLTASLVIIVSGARKRHILWIVGIITSIFAAAILIEMWIATITEVPSYKLRRLTSYLNPWDDPLDSGHQLIQSWFALGHGGLYGAGFGQSIQKLHYLPFAHNDFIFAVIGEELGFIGASVFLFVYLLFIWRGFLVALRCSDITGTLVGIGIVGMFSIQILINIGGVVGAIPITGVTLPFISYGGTSLLASMFAIGILLSISRENSKIERHSNKNQTDTLNHT